MNKQKSVPDDAAVEAVDSLIGQHEPDVLFRLIHERRRKAIHAAEKKSQPNAAIELPAEEWNKVLAELRRPISAAEIQAPAGIDYMCQTVQDCIDAGSDPRHQADLVFALVRVFRKAWMLQNHLGPIDGPRGAE